MEQCIPCCLLAALFICLPISSQVIHIFSHIHQTYVVYSLPLDGDVTLDPALSPSRWVTEEEFHASAVSTAMKKVLGGTWAFPLFPVSSWESLWHPPNLCRLSWLQDPAAVQLWALLCFLQVLKAHEKQRGKESSPGKVSIAGGCMGSPGAAPFCCGPASGVWCWSPPGVWGQAKEHPQPGAELCLGDVSGGCAWLTLSLDVPVPGAPCSRGDPWRLWGLLGFSLALLHVSRRAPSGSGGQKRREQAAPALGHSSPSTPSSRHRLPHDGTFHVRDHQRPMLWRVLPMVWGWCPPYCCESSTWPYNGLPLLAASTGFPSSPVELHLDVAWSQACPPSLAGALLGLFGPVQPLLWHCGLMAAGVSLQQQEGCSHITPTARYPAAHLHLVHQPGIVDAAVLFPASHSPFYTLVFTEPEPWAF